MQIVYIFSLKDRVVISDFLNRKTQFYAHYKKRTLIKKTQIGIDLIKKMCKFFTRKTHWEIIRE